MKEIAVAVDFAEQVAIARAKFKRSELSQMDLDWHESKWKTFLQSKEVNALLDELTAETTVYYDIEQKLRSTTDSTRLFFERATSLRKLSLVKHRIFETLTQLYTTVK